MTNKKVRKTDMVIFFLFHTFRRFNRDNGLSLSAEAAYYLIMSFIPFMIFLTHAILFFMAPQISLILKGLSYLPPEINDVLAPNVYRVLAARSSVWLIIGLGVALWAAAAGMQVLVQASDQTFHEDRNKQNWFIVKIKSMIFMLFLTFSILVSLGLTVFGNAVIHAVHHYIGFPDVFWTIWTWTKYLLPFASLIVTLTTYYHFAPYAFRPRWRRSLIVSIFVTLLWLLLTSLYSYYMQNISDMGLTYGSLIGIIALFIWFRLIAMAIIMGSEILMAWQDLDVLRAKKVTIPEPPKRDELT